jgi:hypothetical protein
MMYAAKGRTSPAVAAEGAKVPQRADFGPGRLGSNRKG